VAALLWALHPLRVEAVSWVTGRRDVLSATFLFLALGAWLRATDRTGPARDRWLGAAVTAYVLALGSKAIVMAAGLALVALEVYPLRRLAPRPWAWVRGVPRAVWGETAPFLLLGCLGAGVSSLAVARGIGYEVLGPVNWLGKALVSLAQPIEKTLVPVALSPLYEMPRAVTLTAPQYWASALLVVAGTGLVIALRHRWPAGPVAWIWYVAFLAPVSAVAHAGPQLTADRYSYLPTLALFVPAGAAVGALAARPRPAAVGRAAIAAAGGCLVVLAGLTWQQQAIWRDTGTLWRYAAAVTSDCPACQANAGHALLEAGQPEPALVHFERAVALRPERASTYRGLGLTLEALGRREAAIDAYRRGLAAVPGSLALRLQLAQALLATGRPAEVVETMAGAWRLYEPAALVPYFEAAVRHRPESPVARLGLARAWRAVGALDRARAEDDALRRLDPGLAGLAAAAAGSP